MLKIFIFEPSDNVGAYWVRDSCEALKELGNKIEVVKLVSTGKPLIEILKRLKEFAPNLIFTINHIGLIPEFVEVVNRMSLPVASWFVDDPFRYLSPEIVIQNCIIFSCDKFYIQRLKDFGFKRVYYLPGATNPKVFKPIRLTQEEKERFCCNISFVGNSIYHAYATYKKYHEWIADPKTQRTIEEVLRLQKENHLLDISDILEETQRTHNCLLYYPGLEQIESVKICLEFAAMSLYRKKIIESVANLGLKLFGDDGWCTLLDGKIDLQREIDYRTELPKLYNASKINLNITKTQLKTTINQRVFDVAACKSFLLTDYRRDLGSLFEVGNEVVYYKDERDLRHKIQHYLGHEDERTEIAQRAQCRVLKEHTFLHRMKEAFNIIRDFL
ncbi:TPA: hypothetical protein DCX15_06350 [bacterium]|nr:hypothetical protein [bacterium]